MAGKINIVQIIEINVPHPRAIPIDDITPESDIKPIKKPDAVNIKPLVIIAGVESVRAPIIASFLSILFLKVKYLLDITMA